MGYDSRAAKSHFHESVSWILPVERLGEKLDMGRLFRFYTVIVLSFFISLGMAGPPLKAEEGAKIDILGVPQGTVTLNYSLDQG